MILTLLLSTLLHIQANNIDTCPRKATIMLTYEEMGQFMDVIKDQPQTREAFWKNINHIDFDISKMQYEINFSFNQLN